MNQTKTLALFCKVVDNYGDIGICWRLARQLVREHDIDVTLWVDDLRSFARICPQVDPAAAAQQVAGVSIYHWRDQDGTYYAEDVADIVIEFFAVDIPPGYVTAMAQRQVKPVWLNLEGLTAEEWVEGCHTLPSMHPRLPLTKHFFFPGFTARTGGLLREAGLFDERDRFQRDPAARSAFLGGLGLDAGEQAACKVSLFCYPHAPVAGLFDAWQRGAAPVACLVPEGVAKDEVRDFLGGEPAAGAVRTQGMLTVRVLPFVPQADYDRLLWACDVNIVRGEDSFVRAQWAGRPFAWHIYPQDENLHHKKLRAFLLRYCAAQYGDDAGPLERFALAFNGVEQNADWPGLWQSLSGRLDQLACRSANWQNALLENGDLASNLLAFARSMR
ncbi:elongation factor P maturation arginine rhamnosyltransferase EarP [Pseudoduganella umbonata]|uniref:Protein-arginine rhamnosyltransferase n=1 Tax=Pseudoduganella umbonata TaxID=864828 RepID=A0A4P8HML8_9BURK|nr:elongation factor P maturation arginine rhamnosyltransferase EarP [Pseudoduganella umbonata]MBB3222522.1 putative repeat protein (TIGR03837 family) [Pseudoduganella umbonata]QCP10947.1 elongation factor P maturation arginine rhamnosyltransferase EarP [Pseudoduganella umbonata]